MKFFIIIFCLIIGTVAGLHYVQVFEGSDLTKKVAIGANNYEIQQLNLTPQPITTSESFDAGAIIPTRLVIPNLKVDAAVEHVGMDAKRNMDVPKKAMNVAWYNLGYKVGEKGNAVIAGHLDQQNGKPAVFAKLAELKIGDELIVYDSKQKILQFKVTGKRTYENEEFPIETVFGSEQKARLNLITCSGTWNKAAQSYSKRTVVFSELVSRDGV